MNNKVSTLENYPFIGITADSLNKNKFEQNVINDHIKKKKWNNVAFKNDIYTKCDQDGNWEIIDDLGNQQTLSKNSSICKT